jgi:hypothetical protein
MRFNSAYQQLVRWYLSQADLSGPYITPEIVSTLVTAMRDGTWPSLSAIPLDTPSATVNDAMVPLAFDFIAAHLGMDRLAKLAPAIDTSATLGDAICATLPIDPATLERAWQRYLYVQASLPAQDERAAQLLDNQPP